MPAGSIDTSAFADTVVFITNNHTLGGDIVLKGLIDNPLGLTIIHNSGGDILKSGATAGLQNREIDLTADRGSIGGSALSRIPVTLMVNLVRQLARIIQALGRDGVYLDVTARTAMQLPLIIGVGPVRATSGAVNIRINNGVSTTAAIVAAVLLNNGTTLYGKQENITANTFDLRSGGTVVTIANVDVTSVSPFVQLTDVAAHSSFTFGPVTARDNLTITGVQADFSLTDQVRSTSGNILVTLSDSIDLTEDLVISGNATIVMIIMSLKSLA